MQGKMYQVTILRQFSLSQKAIILGHHAGIISISSNLSGPPHTQLPKASPGHTWDAACQKYIFRRIKGKWKSS